MNLLRFFELHHRGRQNAIKRRDLKYRLRNNGSPGLEDRGMRKQYERLPLCGGNKGLHVPATEEERRKQVRHNEKLIRAYEKKNQILLAYQIKNEPEQGVLF